MKIDNKKFLWGVSSSAFQVEGHVQNDMTDWETKNKFKQDGKNPIYNNGANHWKKWESDFELLEKLNVNSYRLSFEWARIQPEPHTVNKTALEVYDKMINRLLELNIRPMLTLHHFSHPRWFHDYSPWHDEKSIEVFCKYVELIAQKFADRIGLFITINEPIVWLLAAYGDGKFPPGEKDFSKMMLALSNLLKAHKKAYDIIKSYNPKAKIGIAKNFIIFNPSKKWSPFDWGIYNIIHSFYNLLVLRAIKTNRLKFNFPFIFSHDEKIDLENSMDFIGVNYYYRMNIGLRFDKRQPVSMDFTKNDKYGNSDLGWENYPIGLKKVIDWLLPYKKPLIITENGIAANDDQLRIKYLNDHLKIIDKMKNSAIFGYYYWSFLDNYEWLEGISARFGLVEVDYENDYQRKIKPSGLFYANYIKKADHIVIDEND